MSNVCASMPQFITRKNQVIGFITHSSFDSRNIKVVLDTVASIFKENEGTDPTYVIYSTDKNVNRTINDFIGIYKITPAHVVYIDDDKEVANKLAGKVFSKDKVSVYNLSKYRNLIDVYNVDLICMFTGNHKCTELKELVTLAGYKRQIQIITMDSNGDYIDHTNENDPKNHMEFYGGIYRNDNAIRKD